jgi:hypothetical protein
LVFKNIINGTYGKQINLLDFSIKILLGFLMEYYITLYMWHGIYDFKASYGVVSGFLGVMLYLKTKNKKTTKKKSYGGGRPPCLP